MQVSWKLRGWCSAGSLPGGDRYDKLRSRLPNRPEGLGWSAVAASDAVPVIVGAAIGAGGAVLAQITASVFNARREREQLDWEKQRQGREWELHRLERFQDLKQDLYASYSLIACQFSSYNGRVMLERKINQSDSPKLKPPDLGELSKLGATIELMASKGVSRPVREYNDRQLDFVLLAANPSSPLEKLQQESYKASAAWEAAHRAMRADLHLEEVSTEAESLESDQQGP